MNGTRLKFLFKVIISYIKCLLVFNKKPTNKAQFTKLDLNKLKFTNIYGTKYINYNQKLIKTAVLLNSLYITGKNKKLTAQMEKAMSVLVSPKFIAPDFRQDKSGKVEIITKDLGYEHLIHSCLPLVNYETRTDSICTLEDNFINIVSNFIKDNYEIKDGINHPETKEENLKFGPDNVTPEKAIAALAALSFGYKYNFKDWVEKYKTLCDKYMYDKLAVNALGNKTGHIFNAAYILYKNTGDKRWEKMLRKLYKREPSIYPYYVLKNERLITYGDYQLSRDVFFTSKQNKFNRGLANVFI